MITLATLIGVYAALFAINPGRATRRARTCNGAVAALCAAYLMGCLT